MPDAGPSAQGSEKISRRGVDTQTAFCDRAVPQMKNETKHRLKAIAIGLLIAAAIVAQGLLETNPNH